MTQIFGTMPVTSITAANTLSLSGQIGTPCLVAGDATVSGGMPAPNHYLLAVAPSVMYWATLDVDLASTASTGDATLDTNVLGWAPAGSQTCNNRLKMAGKSGDLVLVVQRESGGDLDIVAAKPSPAAGCTFTLQTGDLAAGSASASVDQPWGSTPTQSAPRSPSKICRDFSPGRSARFRRRPRPRERQSTIPSKDTSSLPATRKRRCTKGRSVRT